MNIFKKFQNVSYLCFWSIQNNEDPQYGCGLFLVSLSLIASILPAVAEFSWSV